MNSHAADKKGSAPVKRAFEDDPRLDNTQIDLPPYSSYYTYKGSRDGECCSAEEYRRKMAGMTQLQKHVAWFDGDADGVIWPTDTFRAFSALNFGVILSILAALIIHGPFSYPTIPTKGNKPWDWFPDPFMRIWVANINKCKHGSDSESYRRTGEFNEERFNNLIHSYSSKPERDGLSFKDMCWAIYERKNVMDFFGIFAMTFELGSSYMLIWPEDGYCSKQDLLGVYDGSIFPALAARRREKGAFKLA